ncbi:MAG: hypothetical protein WC785_04365 [Tatlockia sp.]|jgi:hypothetical protein
MAMRENQGRFQKEVLNELHELVKQAKSDFANAKNGGANNEDAKNAEIKFNHLKQLHASAVKIDAQMIKALKDKSMTDSDKDMLNQITENAAKAVSTIKAGSADESEIKTSASNLASLSKDLAARDSPVLRALGVSLMTFAALALVTAGVLIASVAAIPTFGLSLVVATGVLVGSGILATPLAMGFLAAGSSNKTNMAKSVSDFKNTLQQIGGGEKESEEDVPGGPNSR